MSLKIFADAYLSYDSPHDMHRYVCLALLALCKEAFEELDRSEARSLALSLPAIDVELLLQKAESMQRNLTALD